MNIILVFLLFIMRLNEFLCKPLKSNEQLKTSNTLEDAENKYLWTIRQLERCYVWSKTLPFEDRLDYLITLRRKVYISTCSDQIVPIV